MAFKDNDGNLIPISHYGLHFDHESSLGFLHQGGRNAPNFVGLRTLSPFQQKPERSRACPHNFNISAPAPDRRHWDRFLRFFHDPLIQEMLPIPKERFSEVPYIIDPCGDLNLLLMVLAKLSSPIYKVVLPLLQQTEKQILDQMHLTNVTPLVLTGCKTSDQSYLNQLAKEAQMSPRRVIFTGEARVIVRDPMKLIEPKIGSHLDTLLQLPGEQLGVALLRRFLRGEILDAPYPREEQ